MIARFEFNKFLGNISNGEDSKAKVGDGDLSCNFYIEVLPGRKIPISFKINDLVESYKCTHLQQWY